MKNIQSIAICCLVALPMIPVAEGQEKVVKLTQLETSDGASSVGAAPGAAPAGRSSLNRASGITEPIRDAILSSPVAGIVGVHHFAEGDVVEEGQVIVELRNKLEQIEVSRRKTILAATKRELDRTSKLFKSTRSVSVEDMEESQAKYDVALAEYETAEQQLKIRQIAAPFSGRVTDLYGLEDGEGVQIQTPLARLVDSTRCNFVAHVDSRMIEGLAKGGEVVLEFDTGSAKVERAAQITLVSSVIDPSSGLLKVRANFENEDGAIRAGLDGVMVWKRDTKEGNN